MIDVKALKRKSLATETIGIRVDSDLKAWIDAWCETEGVSVSSVCAELLRDFRKSIDKGDDQ